MEVEWKSNGTLGRQMEVVGSGLGVDGNVHALPWKFPLRKLAQGSGIFLSGSKLEAK